MSKGYKSFLYFIVLKKILKQLCGNGERAKCFQRHLLSLFIYKSFTRPPVPVLQELIKIIKNLNT